MKQLFISNAKLPVSIIDQIVCDESLTVETLKELLKGEGDLVFVIDVHCRFKQAERMQQQGGVKVFHGLRKIFVGRLKELRIVFYSPISRENLVRLKPENEILNSLPFIEVNSENEQFRSALQSLVDKYDSGLIQIETLLFNYPGKR